MKKKGKVIIIVAPSGTGKSTLIRKLIKAYDNLKWSVSCTTRPKRVGEQDGEDYYFISQDEFRERIKLNDFVEWAEVHSNYYGTSKAFLEQELEKGVFVLCDVDVQGADSIKKIFKEEAQAIFIEPPSIEALRNRLEKRATDKAEVIAERVNNAKKELTRKNDYDFLVMNDDIDKAYRDLTSILDKIIR